MIRCAHYVAGGWIYRATLHGADGRVVLEVRNADDPAYKQIGEVQWRDGAIVGNTVSDERVAAMMRNFADEFTTQRPMLTMPPRGELTEVR